MSPRPRRAATTAAASPDLPSRPAPMADARGRHDIDLEAAGGTASGPEAGSPRGDDRLRSPIRTMAASAALRDRGGRGVREADEDPPANPSADPSRSGSPLAEAALGLRLLLAEDSPTNQKAVALCLEIAGAEVTVAPDGAAAVAEALKAEAERVPFDAILMDMQMPVLDGYEATRQLRRRGYSRPIIALTASGLSDKGEECRAVGCDAFARKPIRSVDLIALIRRLCDR